MMKGKCAWSILILFLLLISLIIIPKFNKKEITIKIGVFSGSNWDVPEADSYRLLDQAIEHFEKEHPHVHVTYESGIRKDQYEEWLAQKTMKDDMPDLFFIPSELFTSLAKNGSLENLDTYVKQEDEHFLSSYYKTSLQEGMLEETMYALPYESVPSLMFVNKTLLEEEGIPMPSKDWTWDDFYEICKKVTKDTNHDGTIDQFGYYGYTWQQAAYSNGAQFYDEVHHQVNLDDARVKDAIEFLRKCTWLHDERITSQSFDKGLVAFCPMNYSTYRTYMPYPWRVKKYSSFEWDSIPFPKGPQGMNTSVIDTLMIAMSSRSDHKALAWEFMKYVSSDETFQKQLAISSQGVSVLPSIMEDKDVKEALNTNNPGDSQFEISVLDTVMKQGIAIRKTQDYEQIMQTADAEISTLLRNDQDIENRLILLEHQMNSLLSK